MSDTSMSDTAAGDTATGDTADMRGSVADMAAELLSWARQHQLSIACAESLTGGLLCATLVGIPGASNSLAGGVVTYTNQAKTEVLGVESSLLSLKTAYCAEVAVAMCTGVRQLFGADIALATTGVAGPGADQGHAPGSGFVAVAMPSGQCSRPVQVAGSRSQVRQAFVRSALQLAVQISYEQTEAKLAP